MAFRTASRLGTPSSEELDSALGKEHRGVAADLIASGLAEAMASEGAETSSIPDEAILRLRPPETAIAHWITDWSARLRAEAAQASALLAAAPALADIWRASFERDSAEIVIDRVDTDGSGWFGWWRYLSTEGGGTLCAVATNLDALAEIETHAPGYLEELQLALRSGMTRLELIVPSHARISRAARTLDDLAAAGARLRVDDTAGWFAVAQGRAALIPEAWGIDENVAALVVRAEGLVGALEALFRLRWSRAAEWRTPGSDRVLDLLCEGHHDAEVATILGISVRSVRRRVADAQARYGVRSRMALAHLLARSRGGAAAND